MTKIMLAVFLRGVDDRLAVVADAGFTGELLGACEQVAPLRCQEIDHAEPFAACLEVGSLGRQKVDVRIAGDPALGSKVAEAFQRDRQMPLVRLDGHKSPQGLVFESAGGVDQDRAPWQPTFAAAVNVSVGGLTESDIAPDISVPRR